MGRQVKRVSLDFSWPLNMVWKGYLSPYSSQECKACGQSGYNPATKKIADGWYASESRRWVWLSDSRRYNDNAWQYHLHQSEVDALVDAGRLHDLTSEWKGGRWIKKESAVQPTPEDVRQWALNGTGHDAINRSICVETRAKRLGVWGNCEVCAGEGAIWHSPEIQKAADDWEGYGPPAGDGWQMWETTSEGSPISPVFATPEELGRWLVDSEASAFGRDTASYEQWMRMIVAGWCMSAVSVNGGPLQSGVSTI